MKNKIIRFPLLKLALVALLASYNWLTPAAAAQQWTTNTLPPGLVAWWSAENNMLDSVGTHDGIGSATPSYGSGRFGQAFQFNGTDQSVMIPDGHADLDGWTQFTLEAWVNFDTLRDSPGPGQAVISKVGNHRGPYSGNFGYQFGFGYAATKLFCQFNTDTLLWPGYQTIVDIPFTITTNVWYHVAATYDHNAVKLYLNGVPLVTNVIGPVTIANTVATLRISKDDNDNVAFAGSIDDARIYNRALSQCEIAYLYAGPDVPVTLGLKLHYDASDVNAGSNPADGTLVTTWRDLSGLGLDATPLFGVAPVYRTNALNGRAGVDFGVSGADALASANSAQLAFTNCTIFMVANRPDGNCHVSISAPCIHQEFAVGTTAIYHHAYPYHYAYRSHQDTPANYYVQAGVFGVQANQLDNWINGVLSTNGFGFGQQSPTFAEVPDYAPVARQAILGWRNTDANCNAPIALENFNGVICEVLVYDRQLSLSEVDALNCFLANKYGLAVTPLPPVLTATALASGTVALAWPSTLGRPYQLQSAPSLPAANWMNEGGVIPGTGGVLTTNLPCGAVVQKFFRLQVNQ